MTTFTDDNRIVAALPTIKYLLDNKANKYLNLVSKLETLSPLLTLQRGYTITKKDGKVISSSKKIKKGDTLEINFSDGGVDVEVL